MASAELFLSDKGWFPRSEAIIWVSYLIVANTCDLAVERKAHVFRYVHLISLPVHMQTTVGLVGNLYISGE